VAGFGFAALPHDASRADYRYSQMSSAERIDLFGSCGKGLATFTANRPFAVLLVDYEHLPTAIAHGVSRQRRAKPPCLITVKAGAAAAPPATAAIPKTNP
jgi:hypothetical protein